MNPNPPSIRPADGVGPWLDPEDLLQVEQLLVGMSYLPESTVALRLSKAGEGNMNLTLRVAADERSVILKQSRPWVEKYPSIAAPDERICFEYRFYQRGARIPAVAKMMPAVIGADLARRVMLLEDLGEASDFSTVYEGGSIRDDEIAALASWSAALHADTRGQEDPSLANRAMRKLNHAHIFVLPLGEDLDVPLDDLESGLKAAAQKLRSDSHYVAAVHGFGKRYLADGPCLLHGDYYPGSWLRTGHGTRVIDPEFCFFGDAEFDVAVALAHLALAGLSWSMAEVWLETYRDAGGQPLDEDLLSGYAGTEVMRRIIGVAQLPLPASNGRRAELLERSRLTLLHGELEQLWK